MAKLRKLVVDDREFLWRVATQGELELRVWFAGHKHTPFQLTTRPAGEHGPRMLSMSLDDQPQLEELYRPGLTGPALLDWFSATVDDGVRLYNLHRPGVVAGLIRIARARGWTEDRGLSLDLRLFTEAELELPREPIYDATLELATGVLEAAARAEAAHPSIYFHRRAGLPWRRLSRDGAGALLAAASLFDLGFAIVDPEALTDARRDEARVWADGRLEAGRPGGLAVAHRLAAGLEASRDADADLQAWARELLARLD